MENIFLRSLNSLSVIKKQSIRDVVGDVIIRYEDFELRHRILGRLGVWFVFRVYHVIDFCAATCSGRANWMDISLYKGLFDASVFAPYPCYHFQTSPHFITSFQKFTQYESYLFHCRLHHRRRSHAYWPAGRL